MKKIISMLSFFMAGLMAWFSPIQMAEVGICCTACQLKKEEETKIEYVEEVEDIES